MGQRTGLTGLRYISSLCLVVLTATASGPLILEPQNQYIWSGAFYYGIYAAVLYFVCSSLMVVTFWGAMKGYYSKDFQLTTSQRTLMLQTIMFLGYLLIGALVFSKIEGWPYLDAVYWADVTLFTVGFGDFSAATPLGRALLFPYALVGIISLGLVVGSIRSLVLERGRRQLGARMTEKTRKRKLRRMAKRGKDDILIPVTEDDEYGEDDDYDSQPRTASGLTEYERRQKEFDLMRKIQAASEQRRRWMAMGLSTTVWLCLWLVGAVIFQQCEVTYQKWTYFDGFYFAFVSLTTIGYGDVTPISPAGKSFFVFWSLLALPTMTVLVSNAGDTVVKLIREWTDWLGTVTILPGERGIKKELKIMAHIVSKGKLFSDHDDIKESAPGFLGDAQHGLGDGDGDEDEENDEKAGRQRPTDILKKEIRAIVGNDQVDRDEAENISDEKARHTASAGTSSTSDKDIPDTDSSDAHRPSQTNPTPSITFAEPASSAASSRKMGTSLHHHRASSKGSSRSSKSQRRGHNTDINSQTLPLSHALSIARTGDQLPSTAPANRHDLAVVLIDEISRVTQHLKTRPPRKYSFEEWAWFLKLVGEDESSAETHIKPVPRRRGRHRKQAQHDGDDVGADADEQQQPERLQWSWVGSRSPLMGSQEEAEWILEKLEQRLAELLRGMRAEANWKSAGVHLAGGSS